MISIPANLSLSATIAVFLVNRVVQVNRVELERFFLGGVVCVKGAGQHNDRPPLSALFVPLIHVFIIIIIMIINFNYKALFKTQLQSALHG